MRVLLIFWGLFLVLCHGSLCQGARAQNRSNFPPKLPGSKVEVYKRIDDVQLNAYIFFPPNHQPDDRRAAIVFFFGGGWRTGSPVQFQEHCKYLAERGMVAITADYRVASRHEACIADCVADGKSAIKWVRKNADRLGVDPNKIAASGGSAGGHVAACTGIVPGFESPDSPAYSSASNALVLFNPVVVLAPIKKRSPLDKRRAEQFTRRAGCAPEKISPFHHVGPHAPATILFHGKADTTVPYWTVEKFAERMKECGNRCELVGFEGQGHGFFNFGRADGSNYRKTVQAMDDFLVSLGYLNASPAGDSH